MSIAFVTLSIITSYHTSAELLTASPVPSIDVGNRPYGVTVDWSTGKIYVSNSRSDSVSVIDQNTDRVMADVTVGTFPFAIISANIMHSIYVANTRADTVYSDRCNNQ